MTGPTTSYPAGQRAEPITGQYRVNLSEFIFRLARAGNDDPSIAATLGITAAQVRGIRREYGIEAGEQRWRGGA